MRPTRHRVTKPTLRVSIATAALATLVGCASPSPDSSPLATEPAGERYLNIVCPGNIAADESVAVMDALGRAYFSGEAADLSTGTALAASTRDLLIRSAELLNDTSVQWPESVRENITIVASNLTADSEVWNQVAEARTFEEAFSVRFAENPEPQDDPGQRIRLELGMDTDVADSCAGRENGHDVVTSAE